MFLNINDNADSQISTATPDVLQTLVKHVVMLHIKMLLIENI